MAMFFNLQVMSDVSNDVTIEVNFNIFYTNTRQF